MAEALIAAGASVVVGFLAFLGVAITNKRSNDKVQNEIKTSQAVQQERLSELTREVRMHNDFAQRIPVIEEKIKVINHRIEDLENKN